MTNARKCFFKESTVARDATMHDQIFSYGYPRGCELTLPEISDYNCEKDFQAYYIDHEFNPNIDENEYTCFVGLQIT